MLFAANRDGGITHQKKNPCEVSLESSTTQNCAKRAAETKKDQDIQRWIKQGTLGTGINSKNTGKTNASASTRCRVNHSLKNFATRPPRCCPPPPNPNLFLYKIQDVLEVQVIVIVSDALLDVGVENSIHLRREKKKQKKPNIKPWLTHGKGTKKILRNVKILS